MLDPSAEIAGENIVVSEGYDDLPQNIRVTATHTNAVDMTYSVGTNYVL